MKGMESKLDKVVGKAAEWVAKAIENAVMTGFCGLCIVGAVAKVLWLLVGAVWLVFT
jgi:hypothetical protein